MLHSWVCCAATENQDVHECQAITRGEINCRGGTDNNFLLMVRPNTIQCSHKQALAFSQGRVFCPETLQGESFTAWLRNHLLNC